MGNARELGPDVSVQRVPEAFGDASNIGPKLVKHVRLKFGESRPSYGLECPPGANRLAGPVGGRYFRDCVRKKKRVGGSPSSVRHSRCHARLQNVPDSSPHGPGARTSVPQVFSGEDPCRQFGRIPNQSPTECSCIALRIRASRHVPTPG